MTDYFLSYGKHKSPAEGRCAMEWVSYLAGEQHSDQPACVSPVLRRYCIALNDRLGDDERQRLRPYLARTIGTIGDGMDKERLRMCCEFLVHQSLPFYLDKAGRHEVAQKLRDLPADLTVEATQQAIQFARSEAWDAHTKARDRLAAKIRVEFEKRRITADAVADAAAAADAAAVAVAVAAADAAADADADAATAADASKRYWAIYEAVRDAMYAKARKIALEWTAEQNAQMVPAAFDLLERMLPTEVIQLPALGIEEAERVCGSPVVVGGAR